jgi:hypothetical protein
VHSVRELLYFVSETRRRKKGFRLRSCTGKSVKSAISPSGTGKICSYIFCFEDNVTDVPGHHNPNKHLPSDDAFLTIAGPGLPEVLSPLAADFCDCCCASQSDGPGNIPKLWGGELNSIAVQNDSILFWQVELFVESRLTVMVIEKRLAGYNLQAG